MQKRYKVSIYDREENGYVDYTSYLALPFTINEKADESYDVGSFRLEWTTVSKAFAPYTKVKIEVSKTENGPLIFDGNPYYMMIEEDNVQTVYRGLRRFYNHSITVIERTKIADGVYVPDVSVTNPATKTIVRSYNKKFSKYETSGQVGAGEPYGTSSILLTITRDESLLPNTTLNTYYKYYFAPETYNFTLKKNTNDDPNNSQVVQTTISSQEQTRIELPRFYVGSSQESLLKVRKEISYSGATTKSDFYESFSVINNYLFLYTYSSSAFGSEERVLGIGVIDKNDGSVVKFLPKDTEESRVTFENGAIYFNLKQTEDGYIQENVTIKIILIRPNLVYDYYDTNSLNPPGQSQPLEYYVRALSGQLFENESTFGEQGDATLSSKLTNFAKMSDQNFFASDTDIGRAIILRNRFDKYARSGVLENDTTHILDWNGTYRVSYDGFSNILKSVQNIEAQSPFSGLYARFIGNGDTTGVLSVDIPSDYLGKTFSITYSISGTPTNPSSVTISGEGYQTVRTFIKKIAATIDPSYGAFYLKESGISFDASNLLDTPLPERYYVNKNLAEILFDVGRVIKAYPVIEDDGAIRFDTLVPADNPRYGDYDTPEAKVYSSENRVTSYISNVSNVVNPPEDVIRPHYSYWPAKGKFSKASADSSAASVAPDRTILKIDNARSIYYLKSIKVKNCIKDNLNMEVDITAFCPEKMYYDTLAAKPPTGDISSTTNTNKVNCIYWEKGTNIIHIDDLEEDTKAEFWEEQAPTAFKVQNAIYYAYMIQTKDFTKSIDQVVHGYVGLDGVFNPDSPSPIDYRYQVCYVEKFDADIRTEKFNSELSGGEYSDNFNQEANTPAAIDWMNETQTNLLRRSNLDLGKPVILYDLDQMPFLGEVKRAQEEDGTIATYFADDVLYSFNNNSVNCNMRYTKDYNKISKDVAISKEYRQYEIYDKPSVERNVTFNRYIYMSLGTDMSGATNTKFKYVNQFSINRREQPPALLVYFKGKDGLPISYTNMDINGVVGTVQTGGFIMPLTTLQGGNTFALKTETDDNFAISYRQDNEIRIPYYTIFGTKQEGGAKKLKDCRYVDDLGEAYAVSVFVLTEEGINYLIEDDPNEIFPETSKTENEIANNTSYYYEYLPNVRLEKDNREALTFIYQMHVVTLDNRIKWNPALCKYFFHDEELPEDLVSDGKIAVYGFESEILDRPYLTVKELQEDKLGEATVDAVNDRMVLGEVTPSKNYVSWGLVIPKTNEILFHVSYPLSAGQTVTLPPVYFNYFKNKLL